MTNDWTATIRPMNSPNTGIIITLQFGKRPLRFIELFELLANSPDFARWYSAVLRGAEYPAYFWEHPPLTAGTLDQPVTFALLDAPALATRRADPAAFAEYFSNSESNSVRQAWTVARECLGCLPRVTRQEPDARLGFSRR